MNNLQALKSAVSYSQVDANAFTRVLIDRGLTPGDEYAGKANDSEKFKSFELAKADLYTELVTAQNVSEGDLSISISERSNFIKIASGIYARYGEENPLIDTPTATEVQLY